MAPRKQRSDSVTGLVAAAQEAKTEVSFAWPADLVTPMQDEERQSQAQRFADQFYSSRASRDWRPGDIVMIAELAKNCTTLDQVNGQLEAEGLVIEGEGSKGQTVWKKHPLSDAQVQLSNRNMALMRALSLTGTAQDSRTTANNARAVQGFRDADEARKRNGSYSLLAL